MAFHIDGRAVVLRDGIGGYALLAEYGAYGAVLLCIDPGCAQLRHRIALRYGVAFGNRHIFNDRA